MASLLRGGFQAHDFGACRPEDHGLPTGWDLRAKEPLLLDSCDDSQTALKCQSGLELPYITDPIGSCERAGASESNVTVVEGPVAAKSGAVVSSASVSAQGIETSLAAASPPPRLQTGGAQETRTAAAAPIGELLYCGSGGVSGPHSHQAVEFKGAALPEPPWSLVVHIRTSAAGRYQTLVSWGAGTSEPIGVELRMTPQSQLEYGELSSAWHTVQSSKKISKGQWQRAAVVRQKDGATLLYLDGTLVGRSMLPVALPRNLKPAAMSARQTENKNDNVAEGDVRHLRIYNTAHNRRALLQASEPCQSSRIPIQTLRGGASGPNFEDSLMFDEATLPQPPFSLLLRIRALPVNSFQTLVGWGSTKANGFGVEFRLTPHGMLEYGEVSVQWLSETSSSHAPLSDGLSHDVAVIREADGSISLYVDYALVGRGRIIASLPTTLTTFARSARLTGGRNDYVARGNVSCGSIYDTALLVSDISEAFKACRDDANKELCFEGGASGPPFANSLLFSNAVLPSPPFTLILSFNLHVVSEYQSLVSWGPPSEELLGIEFRVTPKGMLEYGELSPQGWHSMASRGHVPVAAQAWYTYMGRRLVSMCCRKSFLGDYRLTPDRPASAVGTTTTSRMARSPHSELCRGLCLMRSWGKVSRQGHARKMPDERCSAEQKNLKLLRVVPRLLAEKAVYSASVSAGSVVPFWGSLAYLVHGFDIHHFGGLETAIHLKPRALYIARNFDCAAGGSEAG
eukprot:TRINITY_DN9802_c0_g3_i3.p1 TRINITY_DN9802_c0_g3~~TRINITY_DN9802_c0_g3_i3.p1  ORF type:complete len:741 (-),score=50.75 TRINITY_DN9802_c0_g3_i3:399-2621(-)